MSLGVLYSQVYNNIYLTLSLAFLGSAVFGSIFNSGKILGAIFLPCFLMVAVVLNLLSGTSASLSDVYYIVALCIHWVVGMHLAKSKYVLNSFVPVIVLVLYGFARYGHFLELKHKVTEFSNVDERVLNNLKDKSGTPFLVEDDYFFIYTWNQSCGQCKALAADLRLISSNVSLPIYPTHIPLTAKEGQIEEPSVILESMSSNGVLLNGSVDSEIFAKYRAAPIIFFNSPIYGMRVIRGYQNASREYILNIARSKESGMRELLLPEIFYKSYSYLVYLLGVLVVLTSRRLRTTH